MRKKLKRIPARVKPTEQPTPAPAPRRERPPRPRADQPRVATTNWLGELMWVSLEVAEKIDKENEEMWRKLLNGELDTEAMLQEELARKRRIRAEYAENCRKEGRTPNPDYPLEILPEEEKSIRANWESSLKEARALARKNLHPGEE